MSVEFAFYPGCLVLQRMPEYEVATRAVLQALGIELEIVQQASVVAHPSSNPSPLTGFTCPLITWRWWNEWDTGRW